jgi:hypothetical protein
MVLAAFTAADSAIELLDCSTFPSLPGLLIRTGVFVLLAPFWVDVAFELASWPVKAFCPTAATGLALRDALLGLGEVAGERESGRVVRLRDGAVVARRSDPHTDVAVLRVFLRRRGVGVGLLAGLGLLADGLDAVTAAMAAALVAAALRLLDALLGLRGVAGDRAGQ